MQQKLDTKTLFLILAIFINSSIMAFSFSQPANSLLENKPYYSDTSKNDTRTIQFNGNKLMVIWHGYHNLIYKVYPVQVEWGMRSGDSNRNGNIDNSGQTIRVVQDGSNSHSKDHFKAKAHDEDLEQSLWIVYNNSNTVLPFYYDIPAQTVQVNPSRKKITNNRMIK